MVAKWCPRGRPWNPFGKPWGAYETPLLWKTVEIISFVVPQRLHLCFLSIFLRFCINFGLFLNVFWHAFSSHFSASLWTTFRSSCWRFFGFVRKMKICVSYRKIRCILRVATLKTITKINTKTIAYSKENLTKKRIEKSLKTAREEWPRKSSRANAKS